MTRGVRIAAASVLLATLLPGIAAAQARGPARQELQAAVDALVGPVQRGRGIDVGVAVETLEGVPVYRHRADSGMVLASNVKLMTTAAALLALPADHRWTTEARIEADELWIRGGGDPSLRILPEGDAAEAWLDALTARLRERGRTRFAALVLDDRWFDREVRHPLWPSGDWQEEYQAPVSAFGLHGNCVWVEVPGDGTYRVVPQVGDALKVERIRPSADAQGPYWAAGGADRRLILAGRLDRPWPEPGGVALQEPAGHFGRWAQHGLRRRGIEVGEMRLVGQEEPAPESAPVHVHESAWTLADAVLVANKDSDNYVSEVLLKTLAAEDGRTGSFAEGAARAREIFAEAGLESTAFQPADGSGLARRRDRSANLASPAALCALMRRMAEEPEGRIYFHSLLVGGVDGRLANRFREAVFSPGRVHAKTGWIDGASSLSGYVLAPDASILVFSIVINYDRDGTERTHNRRFRALQEDILAEVLRAWPEQR